MMFGSDQKDEKTYLIFDIGSNSVAGSWVRLDSGSRPVILFTKRISIDVYQEITADHLLFAVRNALREVLAVLLTQSLGAPERAFVFVSSPWYAAQVRTLSYHKRHPFVFTKRFADELVQKELEKFNNGEHKEWKNMHTEHTSLEHRIVHVELNGYTYRDPIGKKAERAEVVSFMSMMPIDVQNELERIIHSSFHVDVEFHSAIFASYFGLSHMHDVPEDYTILDIRGETTDLMVVRNGHVQEIISIPFGDHTIVRSFANLMNQKPRHMQELLAMYVEGHLDDVHSTMIEKKLDKAMDHVERLLHEALSHIADRGLFPRNMYLYTQSQYKDWYNWLLTDSRLSSFIVSDQSFILHDARTVLKGVVTDEEVVLDPFIVAGTFFAQHKLLE